MRHIISFAPAGDLVAVNRTGLYTRAGASVVRGQITGFSARSRSRLQRKIALLRRTSLPVFLTLTYPADYPGDMVSVKGHLKRFWDWMAGHYSDYGAIWKLEFQARGAPHFHSFLWGVPVADYPKIALVWYRIVASGDANHLCWHMGELGNGNKPCMEQIRSWFGCKKYASKEMGKDSQNPNFDASIGRVWGVRGDVPFSPVLQFAMDVDDVLEFKKLYAERLGLEIKSFSFWGYGYHVDFLLWVFERLEYWSGCPPNFPPGWDLEL